jgi:hypothetical protein
MSRRSPRKNELVAQGFVGVARKIGDPGLAKVLEALSVNIKTERHNANFNKEYHNRADVIAEAKTLKAKAERFSKALEDFAKKRILDTSPGASKCLYPPRITVVRKVIRDVISLCDNTIVVNPGKRGQRSPGRLTCALIVVEAWTSAHGRRPGHNNEKAQEACEDYWLAAGCERGRSHSLWERHITKALQNQSALRDFIRNEIRLSAEGTR